MQSALFAFIIAFLVAYLLTPLIKNLSLITGAVDKPGERRVHIRPVPSLGGIAIYLGVVLAILTTVTDLSSNRSIQGVLVGSTFILILGIVDDLKELRPRYKLIGQILAAAILVAFGVRIEFITNPFGGMVYLGIWGIPLTIFWVVSIINAINLIDGLDGLAAGVSTIAAFTLLFVAIQEGNILTVLMTAALAGGALGFLRYNFNPAKIFMGDTGSMFLGFMLATVSTVGALKSATAATVLVPIMAMGVPIFDTLFAIIRRSFNGKPVSQADQGHLHHRLLQIGLSHRQAVIVVYLISICLGFTAIAINGASTSEAIILVVLTVGALVWGAWKLGIFEIEFTHSERHAGKFGEEV
ncbi:undecaprenyl-phosphate alpha-N-acetylglucosaminyl 1-phosphate transferase [Anoxybacter fermentans]|uniref:Undecaprenyl-phosphate alpha-N-acetylglucosaminyl 1-phosphate transferase n=1 Tax=Anoxybacter fermentans TaxID=1323375 RepID=A0A3Q9HRG6_9FIRM|nr:MraY family glycosyltransferase [Anoxybacter fermentans]AZR74006.1 undecaprenyl-phosphate alpha-N-acetylglucosaminyl 1-phosphate transferase [Anoxybacter fermentans]